MGEQWQMKAKITDTMLYHFIRSLTDGWRGLPNTETKNSRAAWLVEALCATLDKIDAQEALEERLSEKGQSSVRK